MYNNYNLYYNSYHNSKKIYDPCRFYNIYKPYLYSNYYHPNCIPYHIINFKDYGGKPYVTNIEKATKQNKAFRTALWTGTHLQLTLMSINVGEDIGLEVHSDVDQFIRIEEGQALVLMGKRKNRLDFQTKVYDNYVILIPAGTWHNIINTGYKPLKLYSIYAPPEHPYGTIHRNKAEAEKDEARRSY